MDRNENPTWTEMKAQQSQLKGVNKHTETHQKTNSRARWCMKRHRRWAWPKVKWVLSEKKKSNNEEKTLNNQKCHKQLSSLAPERWRLQISGQKQNNSKIKQKSKMGGGRQRTRSWRSSRTPLSLGPASGIWALSEENVESCNQEPVSEGLQKAFSRDSGILGDYVTYQFRLVTQMLSLLNASRTSRSQGVWLSREDSHLDPHSGPIKSNCARSPARRPSWVAGEGPGSPSLLQALAIKWLVKR